MELLLIRHAEPVRVAPGERTGPVDPELTPAGHRQAERLGAWLASEQIEHVVSSPLRRALETAAPVARVHGLAPEVVESLSEYDARADHYIPVEELRRSGDPRWNAMLEGRWEDFGGDHPDDFRARVVPAIEEIIDAHPSRRVAVVCHGGVINIYTAHVLGLHELLWFHPAYTSVTRVAASRAGHRSLVTLNETAHLIGARDPSAEEPT